MASITVPSRENGSTQAHVQAILNVYPWLKQICGSKKISVLSIYPPEDIVEHNHGLNGSGKIHLIKKGKVTKEVNSAEIRKHREMKKLSACSTSPQTELAGDEEACVFVQNHQEQDSQWISVEVFLCPAGATFNNYGDICTWLAEPAVREQLVKAGFPA